MLCQCTGAALRRHTTANRGIRMDETLLALLACPKCRGSLAPTDKNQGLACDVCAVVYPVQDNIPVLLIEEAVPRTEWDAGKRAVTRHPG